MEIRHRQARGLSMVEVVLSMILVGFLIASTMDLVGPMVRSNSHSADKLVAYSLADELSKEIATHFYSDPDISGSPPLGVDGTENASVRSDFDDIDDYNGWSSSPPKTSSNIVNTRLTGWKRWVVVDYVLISDPSTVSQTDTGLKRVTVQVSKNGVKLATIVTYHSQEADAVGFEAPGGGI